MKGPPRHQNLPTHPPPRPDTSLTSHSSPNLPPRHAYATRTATTPAHGFFLTPLPDFFFFFSFTFFSLHSARIGWP